MELLLVIGAIAAAVLFAWKASKTKSQLNEALESNKVLPIYREALKRQNEEIEMLYRAVVDRESVSGLVDVLNALGERELHEDEGNN